MKEKVKFTVYVVAILVLAHLILVSGCGKNPLTGALFSTMTAKVVKI